MTDYILFGTSQSGSAAIEVALARCQVPFQVVDACSWAPGPGSEELARCNPLRQVPTLRLPDGSLLTESAAILIHLGLAFPDTGLIPAAGPQQAQAIRGMVFIAANCYSAISLLDYPERWLTLPDPLIEKALREGACARLYRHWELFADLFSGTPFLAGDNPGALDILAAVVTKWSATRDHLRVARPAFLQLLERIDRHPHVAPQLSRHWPLSDSQG